MGRGIETAMMNFVKRQYIERKGLSEISALFVPTMKNMPAKQFYTEQGFDITNEDSDNELHYTLPAEKSSILDCHWIKVTER